MAIETLSAAPQRCARHQLKLHLEHQLVLSLLSPDVDPSIDLASSDSVTKPSPV